MQGVGKTYPPNKQVLRDIYLSFFYGAKIGVLGLNGSGKSTLLKIMAGVEKNFNGDARPGEGVTVGYLSRSLNSMTRKPCAKTWKRAWAI